MENIFLGKLPTMVQGEEPLGAELIAKLEKYAEDNKLPSFKIVEDVDGNSVAEMIEK
jgi:hypothetical protein